MDESQIQRDQRVEALWRRLDPQGHGELDFKGLQRGFKRIDHPLKNAEEMLRMILRTIDTNGDGKIQYKEFRVFVEATERQLWNQFRSLDRDRNGRLDKDELHEAFRRIGCIVPTRRLAQFFDEIDQNRDGFISFDEWRNFLLFMPHNDDSVLMTAWSFYSSAVTVNAEGDTQISDQTLKSLGYFIAGAVSGAVSRTATAPLDRLKVFLLVNTKTAPTAAANVAKQGEPLAAAKVAGAPIVNAVKTLYKAGGARTFFAGNGLNVIKIMPEASIRFGSYEFSKRFLARYEGHDDPAQISNVSKFIAGGLGGMTAQFCVYPIDTLKFRYQCETVEGGLKGNALLLRTARTMWAEGGMRAAYRGLGLGLVGMFPYSAIDIGTFELLKKTVTAYNARRLGVHEEDAAPGNFVTAVLGATSGALGATAVYPLNVLRTRLQTQGTAMHPPTYTGMWDVFRRTVQNEGPRGLYKGLTPNLFKVAPALSITWVTYENMKWWLGLN